MKTHPPQSQASAPTQVACGLLATWIFILSLAGVSPALHSWLHADTFCEHVCDTHPEDTAPAENDPDGHYCGVIALQGGLAPIITVELPERADYERIHFQSQNQRLRSHVSELRLQARAPPIEI